MIEQFMAKEALIELIFLGLAGIGLFISKIFSSPIKKLKNKIEEHKEKKKQKRIEERREANQPLADGLKELSNKVENLQNDMNNLQNDVNKLKKSDLEQLRQLMDQIYFKHLNEKTISQHSFERYESLQNSYEAEGGNGAYAIRWEEVKTWKKTK